MDALLWLAGGAVLGLLVVAVQQFLQWLATPFLIALSAASAVANAKEVDAAAHRRYEERVRSWQAQRDLNDLAAMAAVVSPAPGKCLGCGSLELIATSRGPVCSYCRIPAAGSAP